MIRIDTKPISFQFGDLVTTNAATYLQGKYVKKMGSEDLVFVKF